MPSDPLQPSLYLNEDPSYRRAFLDEADLEDTRAFLALSKIPRVGFSTINGIYNLCDGHLSHVWNIPEGALREEMRKRRNQNAAESTEMLFRLRERLLEEADRQLEIFHRNSVKLFFRSSPSYPDELRDLESPPNWLFVQGNFELVQKARRIAAIVGTREPSEFGEDSAKKAASVVMQEGGHVLSGLAEGIDAAAHQAAVDFGVPTIAVLGHGINITFPAKTADLRYSILSRGGCVVTEYLPDDNYSRERFVQRNRLQAALSALIIIIEAKSKSGTAHTLRFGREIGRPVIGATTDRILTSPTSSLLRDMMRAGDSVYFLGDNEGTANFRSAVDHWFGQYPQLYASELFVFKGVLEDVKRIAEEYAPTTADYDWLIGELKRMKSRSRK